MQLDIGGSDRKIALGALGITGRIQFKDEAERAGDPVLEVQ